MSAPRGEFSSRFGFLMAASGSAVGLGNIWGFPTNTASNGGAAFLVAYLVLAFLLAYPALMAELIIGRHARANAVAALKHISPGKRSKSLAVIVGLAGQQPGKPEIAVFPRKPAPRRFTASHLSTAVSRADYFVASRECWETPSHSD